jgi:hypothetical protein
LHPTPSLPSSSQRRDDILFQPLNFVFNQDLAIAAKLIGFAVHIFFVATVMHDAGMLRAMTQIESVTQLVNGLLDDALNESG